MLYLRGQLHDETELVEALRRGDVSTTEQLVEQLRADAKTHDPEAPGLYVVSRAFRGEIVGYLGMLLGGDADAVDEAWNDTLLRVHRRVQDYDPEKSSFRTWLYNQARYAAMDASRRRAKERGVAEGRVELPTGGATEEMALPVSNKERERLRQALGKLTDTERKLVYLRFVMGVPYKEIAEKYFGSEISEGNLRVYVHRALQRLRKHMAVGGE